MENSADILERIKKLHPQEIDLSLNRVRRLLTALNNPQNNLPPVVHIAGTNGKGSVLAYMTAILQSAGYRVHYFTSPYISSFHEYIYLTEKNSASHISESTLLKYLRYAYKVNDDQPITFFEMATAVAFLAFSKIESDIILLETGLGGRWDATNVIEAPLLTVLTPISIDHTEFLGHDIIGIASDKAGILKSKVPCVVARQSDSVLKTIQHFADANDAKLYVAGRDWDVYRENDRLVYQDESIVLDLPLPNLIGHHQVNNAGLAIASVMQLDGYVLTQEDLHNGLTCVEWPGRLHRIKTGKLCEFSRPNSELWLDGGHNPAAGAAIAQSMADFNDRLSRPLCLIIGMMERKDAQGFLANFKDIAHLIVTVPLEGSNDGFTSDELANIANSMGHNSKATTGLHAALEIIKNDVQNEARVLICGSFVLISNALEYNSS